MAGVTNNCNIYLCTCKQIKLPRKNPFVFFTQPLEIFLARRENEVINDVGAGLFEKLSGFVGCPNADNQFSKQQKKFCVSRKDEIQV